MSNQAPVSSEVNTSSTTTPGISTSDVLSLDASRLFGTGTFSNLTPKIPNVGEGWVISSHVSENPHQIDLILLHEIKYAMP